MLKQKQHVERLLVDVPEVVLQMSCQLSLVAIRRDVRAYTQSTSRSLAGEQNKSAVTDHAISLNHVINLDQAKVIDRESNRVDRWIKEAIHIRKEQDKSMNRDLSYQLSHIYDNLFALNLSGERRLDRPFRRRLQSKLKRQH